MAYKTQADPSAQNEVLKFTVAHVQFGHPRVNLWRGRWLAQSGGLPCLRLLLFDRSDGKRCFLRIHGSTPSSSAIIPVDSQESRVAGTWAWQPASHVARGSFLSCVLGQSSLNLSMLTYIRGRLERNRLCKMCGLFMPHWCGLHPVLVECHHCPMWGAPVDDGSGYCPWAWLGSS